MSVWEPRFHGNGFIQVYLDEWTRLHIWSPELPATRVVNAQIHDHRFHFSSTVLMGELHHTEWDVINHPAGQHGLWQQGPGASCKDSPLERVGLCALHKHKELVFKAGDEPYSFGGPGRFHETHGQGLTVTLMHKSPAGQHRAQIVALNNETPDHAFENQPPMELLRAEVVFVMRKLLGD
jgi:hypothetical protein